MTNKQIDTGMEHVMTNDAVHTRTSRNLSRLWKPWRSGDDRSTACELERMADMTRSMSPAEAFAVLRTDDRARLIDVRTPAEFARVHATNARSLPLDQLDRKAVANAGGSAGPLFLICHSGSRSSEAVERLLAAGVAGAASIDGGTVAWAGRTTGGSRRVTRSFLRAASANCRGNSRGCRR